MKKVILGIVMLIVGILPAKQISTVTSEIVAKNFFWEKFSSFSKKNIDRSIIKFNKPLKISSTKNSQNLYYIFNRSNDNGFIIVSGDDDVSPIIGYSFSDNFPTDFSQKSNVKYWMKNCEDQINAVISNKLKADSKISNEWKKYNTTNFSPTRVKEEGQILIQTKWGQDKFYNTFCPDDPNGADGHARVGCVATSMSQIMNYHKYPPQGAGSHSYLSDYGDLTANFGETNYNFDEMEKYLTDYNEPIETLCSHAGISVEMMYGAYGSGAYSGSVGPAMIQYFKYDNSANLQGRSGKSDRDWETTLRGEIDALRPMYYSGSGSGGHAFVCDGYQGSEYFHFNWGWGGLYNGFFLLSNLHPGTHNYSNGQAALISLNPPINPIIDFKSDIQTVKTGSSISFTDCSKYHPNSWNWTFEGATPNTSSDQNPENIVYNTPGTYKVTLSATNWNGTSQVIKNGYIIVSDNELPFSNFTISDTIPEMGKMIQLSDNSLNSPTAWNWNFTPSTVSFKNGTNANSQNPEISFDEAKTYNVNLTTTNSAGNSVNQVNKTVFSGGRPLPYNQNWEIAIWQNDWTINNPDNNITWAGYYKLGGYLSSRRSAWIHYNEYSQVGQRDQLISPLLNLKAFGTTTLNFMYAYAEYNSSRKDSLIIKISTDNGNSWKRVKAFGEDGTGNFATASQTDDFIPSNSDDWASEPMSVDLTAWAGNSDVKIMFESYNGHGNNLFIDDLTIDGDIAPTDDIDAAMIETISPEDLYTNGSQNITPEVIIQNKGILNLTSMIVSYKLNNGTPVNYNWTGNLSSLTKDTISFPEILLGINSNQEFLAYTSNPNGQNDQNTANDQLLKTFGVIVIKDIFYEDFENGISSWDLMSPWGITTSQFVSGSHSLTDSPNGNYNSNLNIEASTPQIDLTNFTNVSLSFSTKYSLEATYDYTYVEISEDDGNNWANLKTFNGNKSTWQSANIDLGDYDSKIIKIRFRLTSDSGVEEDGIYIDDVKISGAPLNKISSNIVKNSSLKQNYPNPFNPQTTIQYFIANDAKIELSIYNSKGENLNTKIINSQKPGSHFFKFNGDQFNSGVYFYTLKVNGKNVDTKKMLLVK